MIGIGQLVKMARGGGMNADELAELMSSLGIEMEVQQVKDDERGPVFQRAAGASLVQGSKVVALNGRMKDGERLRAILVISPASIEVTTMQ